MPSSHHRRSRKYPARLKVPLQFPAILIQRQHPPNPQPDEHTLTRNRRRRVYRTQALMLPYKLAVFASSAITRLSLTLNTISHPPPLATRKAGKSVSNRHFRFLAECGHIRSRRRVKRVAQEHRPVPRRRQRANVRCRGRQRASESPVVIPNRSAQCNQQQCNNTPARAPEQTLPDKPAPHQRLRLIPAHRHAVRKPTPASPAKPAVRCVQMPACRTKNNRLQ